MPDKRFVRSACAEPVFHKYWYGAVPPLAVMSMLPAAAPKQTLLITTPLAAKALAGWYIVSENVALQPLSSRTVTKYGPATWFKSVGVVRPLFHWY